MVAHRNQAALSGFFRRPGPAVVPGGHRGGDRRVRVLSTWSVAGHIAPYRAADGVSCTGDSSGCGAGPGVPRWGRAEAERQGVVAARARRGRSRAGGRPGRTTTTSAAAFVPGTADHHRSAGPGPGPDLGPRDAPFGPKDHPPATASTGHHCAAHDAPPHDGASDHHHHHDIAPPHDRAAGSSARHQGADPVVDVGPPRRLRDREPGGTGRLPESPVPPRLAAGQPATWRFHRPPSRTRTDQRSPVDVRLVAEGPSPQAGASSPGKPAGGTGPSYSQ